MEEIKDGTQPTRRYKFSRLYALIRHRFFGKSIIAVRRVATRQSIQPGCEPQ